MIPTGAQEGHSWVTVTNGIRYSALASGKSRFVGERSTWSTTFPTVVVGSLDGMATRMNLGTELQAVVELARARARASGELLDGPVARLPPDELSPPVRAAIADWVDSGDYDRAVAELVADDPQMRTQ